MSYERNLPHPLFADFLVRLHEPGPARCGCGALLLKVCGPSSVEIKCRRCGRLVEVLLEQIKM